MDPLNFKITQKTIENFTKKRVNKEVRRVWKDRMHPLRVVWTQSGKSEASTLRFRLLQASGWDEGWAVMEWHRLPKRLQDDLKKLDQDGKLTSLLEQDEKVIWEANQKLKQTPEYEAMTSG
jgi:hypothetical protein